MLIAMGGDPADAVRLDSVLDHVAAAVPDLWAAQRRWVDELGGGRLGGVRTQTFETYQLRYPQGGKLELVAPAAGSDDDSFVRRFLARFGAGVHHLTLMVGDLHKALGQVEAAGLEVVDVADEDPVWQEFFLRPRQLGGIVAQVAATSRTESEWLAHLAASADGPTEAAAWAPALLGARLQHPDLDAARATWTLLGATVSGHEEELLCSWPNSPLTLAVSPGEPAGPLALRMTNGAALPADESLGPAVEPQPFVS